MTKNKFFDLLVQGKKCEPVTAFEKECVKQYNHFVLYDRFGRTPYDIAMLPFSEYESILLIMSKEAFYKNLQNKKNQEASKGKR